MKSVGVQKSEQHEYDDLISKYFGATLDDCDWYRYNFSEIEVAKRMRSIWEIFSCPNQKANFAECKNDVETLLYSTISK